MNKQWDYLWTGVNVATLDGNSPYGIIENGAIAVQHSRIAWLGEAKDLPDKPNNLANRVVTLENVWLTPGLIDCHTHLVYAGNRSSGICKTFEWDQLC